jgi:hypothetical protein
MSFLAHLSFPDRLLSVLPFARPSVNFYIFNFFFRTTGPILIKLGGTNHPGGRGFLIVQMKGLPFSKGR